MNSSGLFFSYDDARLKLESWCAYQDRCEFDVRKKIASYSLEVVEVERLVGYLKDTKFLDDERFVESFVSGKVKIKRWGRIKIKAELQAKRIHSTLIFQGLEMIDDGLYIENLKNLTEKKLKLLCRETDSWKKKNKAFNFLASKGYELDLIQDVYKELAND